MKILFFCPLWGSSDLAPDTFAEMAQQAGYDGVEAALPITDGRLQAQLLQAFEHRGLTFIAQHWETADPDPDKHLAEYVRHLEHLVSVKPLLVNSQTGKDWFTVEQNTRLIAAAKAIAERSGVKIIHETHRGKFSFNARTLAQYLEADLTLRIAADFSHWCVVSESLLEDQAAAVAMAISRADHIHARVGYPEGPQISDPRAPEWRPALEAHLGWWDQIVAAHQNKGTPVLTITSEFGPIPYMPALPYTGMPVSNQWEINVHMMNFLRDRYRRG